jgi:dihydroorotase
MAAVLPFTARRFARAIVMPNLRPPVVSTAQALAYRQRILACVPTDSDFTPLMTLYLTDLTAPDEIAAASHSGKVIAAKLYPAGATTNSDSGVTDIKRCYPALQRMAELGMPLLIHGEVTDQTDVFEREQRFIDSVLQPLVEEFTTLKIVLEHITTSEAVEFVLGARQGVAATITPQHVLMNRNQLFSGGLRPHHFCLPVLKHERHRSRVLEAATSGNPRFFLGTDSAPHSRGAKETGCGCAGIFSAHAGIELYAEAFDQAGMLDRLEGFSSHFGADFYGLPRNRGTLTLVRRPWQVPETLDYLDEDPLVPLRAGTSILWTIESSTP